MKTNVTRAGLNRTIQCIAFVMLSLTCARAQTTIPASFAAPAGIVDKTKPGFSVRTVQLGDTVFPDNKQVYAEAFLAGTFLNPSTGQPAQNIAVPGPNPGGYYTETDVINYDIDTAANNGAFNPNNSYQDKEFPGAGLAATGKTEQMAAEILTWLDLPAGTLTLVVNSDDGFAVYIGNQYLAGDAAKDSGKVQVGIFDNGRGASPTPFQVIIQQAGLYPVRLVWEQATGGANLEFYSQAGSTNVLINDTTSPRAPLAIKAYEYIKSKVVIASDPANKTVGPGQTATFTVSSTAAGATYQWQKAAAGTTTFADIAGATSATLTTAAATTADSGNQYQCKVSATGLVSLTSHAATLTVDSTPPTVTKASGVTLDLVKVSFSEAVSAATAGNPANYTISGLTVTAAALDSNGVDVLLTTGQQTSRTAYSVVVKNVTDLYGNVMAQSSNNFTSPVKIVGAARHRYFNNTTQDDLQLFSDPRFLTNNPTFTTYEPLLEYPVDGGNEAGSNYSNELVGWVVPPVSGDYTFYVSGDDHIHLFLSTDENPANKKQIAFEPQWNSARQWLIPDRRGTPQENISEVITLQAGKQYYLQVVHHEGGGGDSVGVAWQIPGAPAIKNNDPPIAGSNIVLYLDPATVPSTPPTVTSVRAITPDLIQVSYSGRVDAAAGVALANYAIAGLTINSISLDAKGQTAYLHTAKQTPSQPYNVIIKNITDFFGNSLVNTTNGIKGVLKTTGLVLHKYFNNTTVDDTGLPNDPRYPDNPTFRTYEPLFEYGPNGSNEAGSNYSNEMFGWLVAPSTGDYTFFVSGDDHIHLYLSTDENPANKRVIANEPEWNNARQWVATSRRADPPQNKSAPITLEAGKEYYIQVLHHEGGGGDSVGVAWEPPGLAGTLVDGDLPINGTNITLYLNPDSIPPFTLVSAGGSPTFDHVTVNYSIRVNEASAINLANYSIPGLTISSAQLLTGGTSVLLATSVQKTNELYTLTVTGVKDFTDRSLPVPSTAQFHGWVVFKGAALHRYFDSFTSGTVEDLLTDPRYPSTPTFVNSLLEFEYPPNAGTEAGSNYGNEISALLFPPVTGDYTFYISSDDHSSLYLSTDENPANKALIATEPQWNGARQWTVPDRRGTPPENISAPIHLEAGKGYYIQALHQEGGGGDNLSVTWQLAGTPVPKNGDAPIAGKYLGSFINPDGVSITITGQPTNLTVAAASSAKFSVKFTATSAAFGPGVYTVQWQKNGVDIPGATSADLVIPFANPADNGAKYHAVISVSTLLTKTSDDATLTLTPDTTPPTVKSAAGTLTSVALLFSEPMDSATAGNKANYSIDQGVTITGATVTTAGTGQSVVTLTASGLAAGNTYTVTINNVKDLSQNLIAANSKTSFLAAKLYFNFDDAQLPPNTSLFGSASIDPTRGIDGTGVLQLTPPSGGQQGSFIIEDLDAGKPVYGFQATFKMRIGDPSGNPADGVNFSWASDIADGSYGEEGTGSGLVVEFDTFDNGGADSYGIDVKWGGTEIATTVLPKDTGNSGFILVNSRYTDVSIGVYNDTAGAGFVYVSHDNKVYYSKLDLPGFAPISAGRFEIGGRTGGEWSRQTIDNLAITTFLAPTLPPPQPPVVSVTAPANGDHIAENASVTITADASVSDGNITKVEFFANGSRLGEDTTAPYSFTVPAAPKGVYAVTAKATTDRGLTATSAIVWVIVGSNPTVLLVVGGNPDALNASDGGVQSYVYSLGYDVQRVGDSASVTTDADGKALIITSSTVGSGNVGNKFQGSAVPVVNWEQALQDNYNITDDTAGAGRGSTGSQTQINIVNTTHPLAAGFPLGPLTVFNSPQTIDWGNPNTNATVIATEVGQPSHAGLYVYEKDAAGIGGFIMPERRIMVFTENNGYASLNADGAKLIQTAIKYGLRLIGPPVNLPPTLSVARAANGTDLVITFANGHLESSDDLGTKPVVWATVAGATSPRTVTPTAAKKFYRVVQP